MVSRGVAAGAALTAAALAAMVGVIGNDIIYDAAALLRRDQRLQIPIDWPGLLLQPYWYQGLWRPVTLLALGAEVQSAGGAVPEVVHFASLLLYVATVLAVTWTATALGGNRRMAFAVGVLFAVHPVHVEVVASVVGQAELLASLAMLAAILLWRRATVHGASQATLAGLLLLQILAAGSKEQGYTLPLLLTGQHLLLRPRLPHQQATRWLAILLLAAATLWMVRATLTGSLAGEMPAAYFLGIGGIDRMLAALGVVPRALMMVIVPVRLGFEHAPPAIALDGRLGWLQLAGIVMILTWGLAVFRWRESRPLAAFGLWWAGVTWIPASSLVVPAGLLLADRVLFLPTIGLTLALASIRWPQAVRWSRLATVLVAVAGCLLAVRSMQRVAIWRDADTFYAAMTRDNPDSYRAWYVRALYDKSLHRHREAEAHLRRALALWPRVPAVHEELGQLLRSDGRCAEAIPIFRAGLALDTARFQIRAKLGECERQLVAP